MSNRDRYDDDDGRTVADMSRVEGRSIVSSLVGMKGAEWMTRGRNAADHPSGTIGGSASAPPCSQTQQFDREECGAAIWGALGASLLIGMIYLTVFAAVIVLLLFLWGVL